MNIVVAVLLDEVCSISQCVAACCSVPKGVAACCSVPKGVAACCSVPKGVAVCCSVVAILLAAVKDDYGVASISRFLPIIGLFCKRAL